VDDVERYGCGLRARRGRCVVINNHHFNHLLTNQRDRDGTEVDAAAAERLFVSLGFEVMRYDDLTINDMSICLREGTSLPVIITSCRPVARRSVTFENIEHRPVSACQSMTNDHYSNNNNNNNNHLTASFPGQPG